MRPLAFQCGSGIILCLVIVNSVALGQVPVTTPSKKDIASSQTDSTTKKSAPKTTFVEFELLQGEDGGGLPAQQWLKILGTLDVSVRIHRPYLNDKSDLKERAVGNLRYVTVIGTLDRSGKITFPDRSFVMADTEKLKEWVTELRTYGIRGNPTGQSLWGLTKEQFAAFFDGLTTSIKFETDGLLLSQLVSKLPFPKTIPLHWTADASELVARRGERTKLRQELNGFSMGTVLSIALGQNGLGFRPNRTPNGGIELLIELRNPKVEQWPVGWPVQTKTAKALPKLYAMVPIELTDVELSDVIDAIGKLSEAPILIDYAELESKQIDLNKIKVSFPRKITTWGIALSRMVVPHRLTREFWQDEAGHVFIWITTSHAGRSNEEEN